VVLGGEEEAAVAARGARGRAGGGGGSIAKREGPETADRSKRAYTAGDQSKPGAERRRSGGLAFDAADGRDMVGGGGLGSGSTGELARICEATFNAMVGTTASAGTIGR
jgi:hypothetical protein